MTRRGTPEWRVTVRAMGVCRVGEVEQAVARGWSKALTCTELKITEAQYDAVRRAMDEAAEVTG